MTTTINNQVMAQNPFGPGLVAVLNAADTLANVGRFRDCWVECDPKNADPWTIHLLTRNGAGYAEAQKEAIESLRSHAWFADEDVDTFDEAYVHYYFIPDFASLSEDLTDVIMHMARSPQNMREYWDVYGW